MPRTSFPREDPRGVKKREGERNPAWKSWWIEAETGQKSGRRARLPETSLGVFIYTALFT